jgi:alcohol dehydrogenase
VSELAAIGVLRPPRAVLFGRGIASSPTLPALARAHGRRVVICTDAVIAGGPHLARIRDALAGADLDVSVVDAAVPELPLESVLAAIERVRALRPDCLVGVGGGSSLDLAKLVALGLSTGEPIDSFYGDGKVSRATLPVIAVPTTAGTGSEVTPVAVLSDQRLQMKVGVSSPFLVPVAAVCDPEVTLGAPRSVTAHAGIDALAHAIEALTAVRLDGWAQAADRMFVGQNLLSSCFGLRAVERIAGSLEDALEDDPAARAAVLEGSLCAGLTFATGGTGAAHALQYPLGARTSTPHGLGVGMLLPYAMRFNAPIRAVELGQIAEAMGCSQATSDAAIDAVAALGRRIGLPGSLADLGVSLGDLPAMAGLAAGITRLAANNARPLDADGALEILTAAWHGDLSRVTT